MKDTAIGFVGAGQMARALAGGFVASGQVKAEQIYFVNPGDENAERFLESVPGAQRCETDEALMDQVDLVWLAVKPQVMASVARPLAKHVRAEQVIVSIAAGLTLPVLADWLGHNRIIRVMPNTPCLVGRGVCVFSCGGSITKDDRDGVHRLLQSVGLAKEVPEKMIDPITGVSGSGPAFVMTVIEAIADGGVKAGIPRSLALELAIETLVGSAELLKVTGKHPAELRDQVASPAGTTIYGLSALESGGLRASLIDAVFRASSRAKKLAPGESTQT